MKRLFPAVLLCLVLTVVFTSCASTQLSVPEGARSVTFRSQGQPLAVSAVKDDGTFRLPRDPVRRGYSFNGWWVTCTEGVIELTADWFVSHPEAGQVTADARWINTSYTRQKLGTMGLSQDGAVSGDYLMRLNASGVSSVYYMPERRYAATLYLDQNALDRFTPHSNCACFGCTYFAEGDEFPLFYTNAYNNYDTSLDRLFGTIGVYRITRDGRRFSAEIVQIIRIGFDQDTSLWLSGIGADRSPYGNMVIDTDNGKMWFFVTRDEPKTTRFFCFDIPSPGDGTYSEQFGVNLVVLRKEDIIRMFDVPYSYYLQGACYHDGRIYSTEGMGTGVNPDVIRVIDLENAVEDSVIDLFSDGYWKDVEFIDFYNGDCYLGDISQTMYILTGV